MNDYNAIYCADCLYALRGRNDQLRQYPTDTAMFAALAMGEPGVPIKSADGEMLDIDPVTSWQGTLLCMPHLRTRWTPAANS